MPCTATQRTQNHVTLHTQNLAAQHCPCIVNQHIQSLPPLPPLYSLHCHPDTLASSVISAQHTEDPVMPLTCSKGC